MTTTGSHAMARAYSRSDMPGEAALRTNVARKVGITQTKTANAKNICGRASRSARSWPYRSVTWRWNRAWYRSNRPMPLSLAPGQGRSFSRAGPGSLSWLIAPGRFGLRPPKRARDIASPLPFLPVRRCRLPGAWLRLFDEFRLRRRLVWLQTGRISWHVPEHGPLLRLGQMTSTLKLNHYPSAMLNAIGAPTAKTTTAVMKPMTPFTAEPRANPAPDAIANAIPRSARKIWSQLRRIKGSYSEHGTRQPCGSAGARGGLTPAALLPCCPAAR